MLNIMIDSELREEIPEIQLGVICYKAKIRKSSNELINEIKNTCDYLQAKYDVKDILKIESISGSRDAYKKLGKDPSRYRISSEALLRRVLQGKCLYEINNIVEINNLISLNYLIPVGSYNMDKIKGTITFRVGSNGEYYNGIGKGNINLENMPVLSDDEGAFGSATSDSEKAMINEEVESLLMVLISFTQTDITEKVKGAIDILKKYSNASDIEYKII